MPKKVVIIGDLNGDDGALFTMARSQGLIDRNGAWKAHDTHFIQLGDIVNRGSGCRNALDVMMQWTKEARKKNSRVTMLLGNHEAMVTLGNEAWCTPEEYLEFASPTERARFDLNRSHYIYQLLSQSSDGGKTSSISGRLRAWEEENVPGKESYEEAFSDSGIYGRYIRSLPVAIRVGSLLLVHGGLTQRFVDKGLTGLAKEVADGWSQRPRTVLDLPPDHALIAEDGPLWDRSTVLGPQGENQLEYALNATDATCMIVGHTRTDHLEGGVMGQPLALYQNRLICADVGIGTSSGCSAALFVERDVIWCWTPSDKKMRMCPLIS
ncbi:MAG: hypothetical protein GY822_29580 [Deltaproteobacteria bacterium]|nr:hypothetical protein [Deltaproteobacteria bacterium]